MSLIENLLPGDGIVYADFHWFVLDVDRENEQAFVISKEPILTSICFDVNGYNDFSKSSLYEFINNVLIDSIKSRAEHPKLFSSSCPMFEKDDIKYYVLDGNNRLESYNINLKTYNKSKGYGKHKTTLGLLTYEEYAKYIYFIDKIIEKDANYNGFWLATALTSNSQSIDRAAQILKMDGKYSNFTIPFRNVKEYAALRVTAVLNISGN